MAAINHYEELINLLPKGDIKNIKNLNANYATTMIYIRHIHYRLIGMPLFNHENNCIVYFASINKFLSCKSLVGLTIGPVSKVRINLPDNRFLSIIFDTEFQIVTFRRLLEALDEQIIVQNRQVSDKEFATDKEVKPICLIAKASI